MAKQKGRTAEKQRSNEKHNSRTEKQKSGETKKQKSKNAGKQPSKYPALLRNGHTKILKKINQHVFKLQVSLFPP